MSETNAELSGGPLDGQRVAVDPGAAVLHYRVDDGDAVYRLSGSIGAAGRAVYEFAEPAE